MAYQQVKTCRFFVNVLEWGMSNGLLEFDADGAPMDDVFRTLPVNPKPISKINIAIPNTFPHRAGIFNDNTADGSGAALFILGHHARDAGALRGLWGNPYSGDISVNWECNYDGWTMASINQDFNVNMQFGWVDKDDAEAGLSTIRTINTGSIIYSSYYTMPHSPDLNLSLSYDYSGVKEITTRGGASLSNSFYSKPPMWGDLPAWELFSNIPTYAETSKADAELARSGRRIWDLSFSYLDDGDVFGSNQSLSGGLENEGTVWGNNLGQGYDTDDVHSAEDSYAGFFKYNILSDDNFYSQVIHKTNGGQLPFIFQPNKDDNTNFAIAKFDKNSFSFQQTAPNLYSVKCRIKEVW